MVNIEWNDSLETGVEIIDDQHKEIFSRVDTLVNLSEEKKKKEIEKMLRFLGGYVVEHFSAEEEYMIDFNYPEYDFHKEEHMQFLKSYKVLMKEYKKKGATPAMINDTQNKVISWLYDHIMRTDKNLAAFLKSRA